MAAAAANEPVAGHQPRSRTPSLFLEASSCEGSAQRGQNSSHSLLLRASSPGAEDRGFAAHKARILRYSLLHDHSPRGVVDPRVVEIVDELNRRDTFATTSSCSGRVLLLSVRGRVEERGAPPSDQHCEVPLPAVRNTSGRWRISHDGIADADSYFCLETSPLLEHRDHLWLIVQPFDLHVACANVAEAHRLLAIAQPVFPRSSVIAPAGVPHRWGGGRRGGRNKRTVVSVQGDQRLEMPFTVFGQRVFCGCLATLARIVNGKLAKNWAAMDRFLDALRENL